VRHGRYIIFQMAEVAIPRQMFQEVLRLIGGATAAATTSASVRCSMSCIQEQPTEGVRPNARKNGQISPSATVRAARLAGSRPHLSSGFRAIQKIAIFHAGRWSSGESRLIRSSSG
jgi:hypothetical protein